MRVTDDDIKKLREAHAASTQGDWRAGDCIAPRIILYAVPAREPRWDAELLTLGHVYCDGKGQGRANMTLIAEMHRVLPALLDEIEALRAQIDERDEVIRDLWETTGA